MDKNENTIVYGRNPVVEALLSTTDVEKVLIQNTLRGEVEKEVRKLCKERLVPISKVPINKLNQISNRQNHQGVAAVISPIKFQTLQEVLDHTYSNGDTPLILILEGVTDVRNVGAIARTAHVFGVHAIVYPAKHSARITEDAIKISSGALLSIPVCREKNMEAIIEICKSNGLKIVATDLNAEKSVDSCDFTQPVAIIMGSEDRGITPETRKLSDHLIKIPQANEFDSLNVSVSTGIVLFQAFSSRN